MINLFKNIFGKATNPKGTSDLKTIFLQGAIILDVRSPEEFASGHIKGALNVPVGRVNGITSELKKKNKPVITCCRSGARSAVAKSVLEAAGLEVYNGGPWNSLEKQIQ